MLRHLTRTLVAIATIATLSTTATPATAAPTTTAPATAAAAPLAAEPRLVDIDLQTRARFDRLTLQFRGGTPDLQARYIRTARLDNGRVVRLPGRGILLLQLDPARARAIPRGTQDLDDGGNVRAFRVLRDRDGEVRLAIAVRRVAAVRIQERTNRIIIDIDNRRF